MRSHHIAIGLDSSRLVQSRPGRICIGCGQPMYDHPSHHRFCRVCHGYGRLGDVVAQALADIRASRP
jgi:hypothetical protein